MKNRLSFGLLFVCTLLCYACSSEDEAMTESGRTVLTLSVEANDFHNSSSLTRIEEEDDYTSTFSEGDTLAIFGVCNGQVLADCNNRPFVYDGTNWVDPSGEPLYHYAQTTYYAYYPYNETSSITNDIQDLVDNFTPKTDQSTREAYIQSDLLTATGSVVQDQLVLQFNHALSLVEISFPTHKYCFSGGKRKPYLVPLGSNFTFTGMQPYELEQNLYRYIVQPKKNYYFYGTYEYEGKTMHFTYSDYTYSIEAGKYRRYNVNKDHNVIDSISKHQGDYFMTDGRIINTNELKAEDKPNVLGIIFYTENTSRFDSYERKKIREEKGQPDIHGYVMALKDATIDNSSYFYYDNRNYDYPNIPNYSYKDVSSCDKSTAGYYYTHQMINDTGQSGTANVVRALNNYNATYPTPRNTTEWFIPSVGQWMEIIRKLTLSKLDILEGLTDFTLTYDSRLNYMESYYNVYSGNMLEKLNNKITNLSSDQYDLFCEKRDYATSQEVNGYRMWSIYLSLLTENGETKSQTNVCTNPKSNYMYLRCILAF